MSTVCKFSVNGFFLSLLLLGSYAVIASADEANKPTNPPLNYLSKGQLVTGFSLSVGDPSSWYTPIVDRVGKSAAGHLAIEPTDFKAQGDAIKLTWSGKGKGSDIASFSISGANIDLSKLEQTHVLVLDLKVDVAPKKPVEIGMGCTYPCKGVADLSKPLAGLQKNQWSALAVSLSCLSVAGLDLTKVSSPLTISTDGKLTLSIANVRLEPIQAGDAVCTKEK